MTVAIVAMSLILLGIASFLYGTIALSRYAFRLSTARGLAVLLFPPYTIYFAFFGADVRGKELPAAAWVFGLGVAAFTAGMFWSPVQLVMQGRFDTLAQRAEAASPVSGGEDNGGSNGGGESGASPATASTTGEGSADEGSAASAEASANEGTTGGGDTSDDGSESPADQKDSADDSSASDSAGAAAKGASKDGNDKGKAARGSSN